MSELSREELEVICADRPAALVDLVLQLQLTVAQLTAHVNELQERLGRNSHNSNQPPASDGFNRPPRALRQPSTNKPGGQPGHKGHSLRFTAQPDRILVHRPQHCANCGQSLSKVPALTLELRQVVDLPPLHLETIEHQIAQLTCPACAAVNCGHFPSEASERVQYGPRIKALGVYLTNYQLVPYERTNELLTDLFGAAPSEATLYTALEQAAAQLEPVEQVVRASLQQAAVAHFDETGFYIKGQRQWLHVACTSHLTLYLPHPQRGEGATRAMAVLPNFGGVAVHDCFSSYFGYGCEHALCNAHHLRELTAVAERSGQQWASSMKALLLEGKAAVATALASGQSSLSAAVLLEYQQRYRTLLAEGLALNPANPPPVPPQRGRVKQSKAHNLLVRLRDHEAEVLRFMTDMRVPFDNNQAERDLRMMKVQQKISGCFRSAAGASAFCRVRGYISTLRKQGLHVLSALEQVFNGGPLVIPATH